MIEKLTSTQNPKIKRIVQLSTKAKERKFANIIVIEGFREIKMALEAGFEVTELYFCRELDTQQSIAGWLSNSKLHTTEVSKNVFEKVAYRENSDGLIALAKPVYLSLEEVKLSHTPLILVLESVEKPGNLGALLRTADAGLIDAVVVCDPQTDIYNPNVIRSSLGCIFTNRVITCSTIDAIQYFKKNNIKTFAAALTGKTFYHETDLTCPAAIVMGTEANGLTENWLNNANEVIKIPMRGKVDSLNVSVSAAILIFEALRQRDFR